MNNYYILFGIKDDKIFYINNTNPILWTSDINYAKIYSDRYTAEYAVLRDWYNFRHISDNIENKNLDSFWISICNNTGEIARVKLL